MVKSTDRLTRVEEIVKNTDKKLDALFNKFDAFMNDTQKVRVSCALDHGKTSSQTSIQWWFIAIIVVSIIGIAVKEISK